MARALMWTLALGLAAWSAWLWPDVPARIPLHFGADGTPDRWGERSALSWFLLPLVGLGLAGGLDALTRWALRHPEAPAINLPNKAAILALPPERRAPVLARVGTLIYTVGALCLAALVLIHVGTWTTATGENGAGWVLAGSLTAIVGPLAALVWGLVRIDAEVRRQQARPS